MVSVLADLHDEAVTVRCASKGQPGDSLLMGLHELGGAYFETVYKVFQVREVCFESVAVLAELGK